MTPGQDPELIQREGSLVPDPFDHAISKATVKHERTSPLLSAGITTELPNDINGLTIVQTLF
jgi:hypothetical protein